MDYRDGAPEIRAPVIWVLMRLGGGAPRSLINLKLSARGNCWMGVGMRVRWLLVICLPILEVHDECPHEGLTKSENAELPLEPFV